MFATAQEQPANLTEANTFGFGPMSEFYGDDFENPAVLGSLGSTMDATCTLFMTLIFLSMIKGIIVMIFDL